MKLSNKFLLLIVLFLVSNQIKSQSKAISKSSSTIKNFLTGQLPNGLTYYIKHLPKVNSKINLRFYIKAGANNQNEHQLNIAHFVEHMAFKSSKNFPLGIRNDLKRLDSITISQFDLNGSAGSYSTSYSFDIPMDNLPALETGLTWFRDIAGNLHLSEEEIDKERGVLMQEMIIRSGDHYQKALNKNKLEYELIPCRQDYSNFFEHHKYFKPETLRNYYQDWYRPENMSVVVVGNINNLEEIKSRIQDQFADLKASTIRNPPPNCDSIYFNRDPQFAKVQRLPDSLTENNKVEIQILYRDPETLEVINDFDGVKRRRMLSLFLEILNNRLEEESRVYNNSYKIIASHTYGEQQVPSSLKLNFKSKGNKEKEAIQKAIKLVNQVQGYSISNSEFQKIKNKHLNELDDKYINSSSYWLNKIKRNIVFKEAIIKKQKERERNWLKDLSQDDFKNFLLELDFKIPQDIGIIASGGHPIFDYSEEEIRKWITVALKQKIKPYISPANPEYLIKPEKVNQLPKREYSFKENENAGTREFLFQNGIRVVLKPFKPNQGVFRNKILLHGFKETGALNFPQADYFSAVNAPEFIKNAGIGTLDKFQFERFVSDKSLWWHGIKPYIQNHESGIKIDGKPEDLETMLQVVYLLLTNPNLNPEAFKDWKQTEKEMYLNQVIDSKHADLDSKIEKVLGDFSGTNRGTEAYKGLDKIDLKKGFKIYNDLLGNAKGFTFILTGDFKTASILPLISKYLGNLPSSESVSSSKKLSEKKNSITGPVYTEFPNANNYKKKNYLLKPIFIKRDDSYDWKEEMKVKALGAVVNTKAWGLRFNKGYSLYTAWASGSYSPQDQQYQLEAKFNCIPEEYLEIRKEFKKIVKDLKTKLISKELLGQSLKRLLSVNDPKGKAGTNEAINKKLYNHYRYDIPYGDATKKQDYLESLRPKDILETANEYLKEEYSFEFLIKN